MINNDLEKAKNQYNNKNYDIAIDYYLRCLEVEPFNKNIMYDISIQWLDKAFCNGFYNLQDIIIDEDFYDEKIKDDPKFINIIKEMYLKNPEYYENSIINSYLEKHHFSF